MDGRPLDARRLRARRDEHRQHVDPRPDDRLRPVRLARPFDPDWTPNITDAPGRRYRFGNQPHVAQWNLVRLANALLPLLGEAEPLEHALHGYAERFERGFSAMLASKLGWSAFQAEPPLDAAPLPGDADLVSELFGVLALAETDMTVFYRQLAEVDAEAGTEALSDSALLEPILPAYYAPDTLPEAARSAMLAWLRRYVTRVQADGTRNPERRARMHVVNPKFVLRNYLAQQAIDAAEEGDFTQVSELLEVLRQPYAEQPGRERFAHKRPDWARNRAGCSMLSCSS